MCVWTNLDLIGPPEAFELPQPHVLRLHPPLPAGGTLLRALPCQHHDQPAARQEEEEEEGDYTPNVFTFHTVTLWLDCGKTSRPHGAKIQNALELPH